MKVNLFLNLGLGFQSQLQTLKRVDSACYFVHSTTLTCVLGLCEYEECLCSLTNPTALHFYSRMSAT